MRRARSLGCILPVIVRRCHARRDRCRAGAAGVRRHEPRSVRVRADARPKPPVRPAGRQRRRERADRVQLEGRAAVRELRRRSARPGECVCPGGAGGVPTSFGATDEAMTLAASHGLTVLPIVIYTPAGRSGRIPPPTSVCRSQTPSTRTTSSSSSGATARTARSGPSTRTCPISRSGPGRSGTSRTRAPAGRSSRSRGRTWRWSAPRARAIRRADPRAKIVLAGMPNYSWRDLEKIYRVPGARRLFDVVAIHPYTASPAGGADDPPSRPRGHAPPRRRPQAAARQRDRLAVLVRSFAGALPVRHDAVGTGPQARHAASAAGAQPPRSRAGRLRFLHMDRHRLGALIQLLGTAAPARKHDHGKARVRRVQAERARARLMPGQGAPRDGVHSATMPGG